MFGKLNRKTVLRFAHAFESGGGTERYLEDLDRALLERNAMTIIRLHLTQDEAEPTPKEHRIGKGLLILVPLKIIKEATSPAGIDEHSFRYLLKQWARDWVLYNPIIWSAVGRRHVTSTKLPARTGQAVAAGTHARAFLQRHSVDLVMLHFFGGADADEVLMESKLAGVPAVLLNHYANDRFRHLAIRKHIMLAQKIAGVSGLLLPSFLRDNFTDLSDGIDTLFFRRDLARPLAKPPREPVILLPGRVIKEKGQLDLVKAAAQLKRQGIACSLAFAGRVDSSGFVDKLREEITRSGLDNQVHFLGALNLEELRDWYAASSAMALPTYHHEGLPRVILEAQAMNLPVVAYASGGVAGGVEDGASGYLLHPGDLAGLTARLAAILSSQELRTQLGQRGRERAEAQFSLPALADRHEQFYLQAMSMHGGKAN